MWVMVQFDLPVVTKQNKRDYRRFRDFLLSDGYMMLQYSIYARPCPTLENAQRHEDIVSEHMPPEGEVRTLVLTGNQFARMKRFVGKEAAELEKQPEQLTFF